MASERLTAAVLALACALAAAQAAAPADCETENAAALCSQQYNISEEDLDRCGKDIQPSENMVKLHMCNMVGMCVMDAAGNVDVDRLDAVCRDAAEEVKGTDAGKAKAREDCNKAKERLRGKLGEEAALEAASMTCELMHKYRPQS